MITGIKDFYAAVGLTLKENIPDPLGIVKAAQTSQDEEKKKALVKLRPGFMVSCDPTGAPHLLPDFVVEASTGLLKRGFGLAPKFLLNRSKGRFAIQSLFYLSALHDADEAVAKVARYKVLEKLKEEAKQKGQEAQQQWAAGGKKGPPPKSPADDIKLPPAKPASPFGANIHMRNPFERARAKFLSRRLGVDTLRHSFG